MFPSIFPWPQQLASVVIFAAFKAATISAMHKSMQRILPFIGIGTWHS
jgi:hypothetical protein